MDLLEKYVIDGNLESIKTVINGNDWKPDSEWKDYNLLKKALIYKHKEITKFFISNNFRVNKLSICDADTTPLHIAVVLEWEDIVLLLLEKGASVMVQDKASNKLTPIQLSFLTRKYQLTDLMLPFDKGQTIPESNINASHLFIACARNCLSVVKTYLRLGEYINTCAESTFINYFGYTPLHFAVDFQSRETVELLLKCGASVTAKDKKQNTPLHLASNLHDKSLMDLLLLNHRYTSYNPKNLYRVSHFHLACTRNNPKVAYGFLQCGVDINAIVEDGPWKGYTALHLAVIHQCVDIVKLLLSQDNLAKDNSEIFLFNVYKTENSEIINLITSRNKIPLSPEFSGKIPLKPFFRSCLNGDKGKIKALISSGVSVNEQLPFDSLLFPGATPLHILVQHDVNFISEIIDLILQKGANVTVKDARGLTPIHVVFQKNYLIESLMKVSSRFKINVSDNEGLSLFHIACAFGMDKVVDWFLDNVDVDVNAAVNEDSLQYPGCTALCMAASNMRVQVFLKLLSHGANITLKNKQGLAPLDFLFQHWSVGYDDFDYDVKKIMSHVIKVYRKNYINFDGLEFNLLHAAGIVGDKTLVKHCIQDEDDITLDSAINSALNSACGRFSGFTPLHFAVLAGEEKIIDLLLDYGADPAARSVEGDTPLHMSMKYLKTLVDLGSRTNELYLPYFDESLFLIRENPFGSSGFSHFHIACQFNQLEVVNDFLNRGIDPDIRSRRPHSYESGGEPWINETGLHAAMRIGHREVVILLLERGADANARDMIQRTPLHKVLEDKDKSMVRLLVESGGADVNARDCDGKTPLHVACDREVLRPVVDGLLEAGADIDLIDKHGQTVINLTAHMSSFFTSDSTERLCSVIEHALRLKVAGCPISEKNEVALASNRERVIGEIGEDFEARCSKELLRMEGVRLDGRTTLRDVLCIRDANQLQTLAGNKVFQGLVEDKLPQDEEKTALDDFPIYGYLARLQFRRGWKRRQMIPAAVLAIRKLVEMYCTRLPDDCAEYLLSYLADDDLERLNEATK